MLRCWSIVAIALVSPFAGAPLYACRVRVPLVPKDIQYADVVVTGRIVNYRVVRDHEFRRKMLANPTLSPILRNIYEDKNGNILTDYARFDVVVDRILKGKASHKLSVTWDNSTFNEPKTMATGPFLVALRKTGSRVQTLRGLSASVLPNSKRNSMTVLQAPCSAPFIFSGMDDEANAVRKILSAMPG